MTPNDFKAQVAQDNASVFLNLAEFGEEKTIDGALVTVVVDHDIVNERLHVYADGTYLSRVVFFVRETDLGYRPAEGQIMRYENYPYSVAQVSEAMGFLEITLEGNRT